jgi:hypothetical protein
MGQDPSGSERAGQGNICPNAMLVVLWIVGRHPPERHMRRIGIARAERSYHRRYTLSISGGVGFKAKCLSLAVI